jgi:hypothetical protein
MNYRIHPDTRFHGRSAQPAAHTGEPGNEFPPTVTTICVGWRHSRVNDGKVPAKSLSDYTYPNFGTGTVQMTGMDTVYICQTLQDKSSNVFW